MRKFQNFLKDTFFKKMYIMKFRDLYFIKFLDLIWYDIPRFCKNVFLFRKALWNHYNFDYAGTIKVLKVSLELLETGIINGIEVDHSRLKKVNKIQRCIYILDCLEKDNFIDLAEKELGDLFHHPFEFIPSITHPDCFELKENENKEEVEHNRKVYSRANEIEKEMWIELWETIKGQDYSNFDKDKNFDDLFDGSGMQGWWD